MSSALGADSLVQTLRALTAGLDKKVENGRKEFESSPDVNDFMKVKGQTRGFLSAFPVNLYVECFKRAGVRSRSELEALWTSMYSDPTVSEAVENLLIAEDNWTNFISELERQMSAHEEKTALPIVNVGERFPMDIPFIDTKSGDTMQLKSYLEKKKYTLFILRKHYV